MVIHNARTLTQGSNPVLFYLFNILGTYCYHHTLLWSTSIEALTWIILEIRSQSCKTHAWIFNREKIFVSIMMSQLAHVNVGCSQVGNSTLEIKGNKVMFTMPPSMIVFHHNYPILSTVTIKHHVLHVCSRKKRASWSHIYNHKSWLGVHVVIVFDADWSQETSRG